MRSLENTPIDRLAQKVAKSRIGRVVIPALMIAGGASACATPSQEIKPTTTISTPTAEPVHTPIAIGVSLPAECQTNPNAVKGWEAATDKQHQLTAADNPSIDAFNDCVAEANKPGEATATRIAATKPSVTPTTAPTAEPTVEVKKAVNCGILSPETCAKAEYIRWETPRGSTAEAIAMTLEAGKNFRIPEPMQVAAVEETYQGKPIGYRIVAVRKDGSQIIIDGDVIPVGVGKVGKELPAGTIVAQSAESGFPTLIEEYTQFIQFTSQEDLKKQFPEQTKNPPKKVLNKAVPASQSNTKGGGVTFFNVPPPQS